MITKFFFFACWLRNPGYITSDIQDKAILNDIRYKQLEEMIIKNYERRYALSEEKQ